MTEHEKRVALIELDNVSKTYRQGGTWGGRRTVRAVDGVSLRIEAGRCLALVGPSGSGKSTLGRLVLGLEKPDSGEVLYKGRPWRSLRGEDKRKARRDIQVVFQNSHGAVNPRFTARDIVGEPLANFDRLAGGALSERVAGLLEMVGLEADDMRKLPHQFSGGELQRVCLARALAPAPGLVVLDEAVSSLDMVNQCLILDILARLGKETEAAFLFITHDLRVVCQAADAVAVMERGGLAGYSDNLDDDGFSDCLDGDAFLALARSVLPARPAGLPHGKTEVL